MPIGSFGKRIFTTSDQRILTFKGFTYKTAARFAEHEALHTKPKTEYLGPGLDAVTFSITLRMEMGMNVMEELEAWRKLAANGNAERLMVGKKRLGRGRWIVTDCSEAWNVITNRGQLLSAAMDISLKEYV